MPGFSALILANGTRPPADFLTGLRASADLFIATDGAANGLGPGDPLPDIVLGDFDSLREETRGRMPGVEFIHVYDQDLSDLEKAVRFALERGATEIVLTGATGTRPDHTLTAFSVLAEFPDGLTRMVFPGWSAFGVTRSIEVHGAPGDTISLTVFGPATVHRFEGVQWPLHDQDLAPGSHGVSNKLTESVAHLEVSCGAVIVCHVRPELARH